MGAANQVLFPVLYANPPFAMNRWLLLTLTLILAARPAAAQDDAPQTPFSDEVYVTQIAQAVSPEARISTGEALDLIYARLRAERHRSALDAYQGGGADGRSVALVHQLGNHNAAAVDQAGASNLAMLYQRGSGNASLLEQAGAGNVFGSYLTGDGNRTDVQQRGTGNVYVLDFAGDGLRHTARQLGSNNQAVQTGQGTVPFSIEQRGNGMQMVIRHD